MKKVNMKTTKNKNVPTYEKEKRTCRRKKKLPADGKKTNYLHTKKNDLANKRKCPCIRNKTHMHTKKKTLIHTGKNAHTDEIKKRRCRRTTK